MVMAAAQSDPETWLDDGALNQPRYGVQNCQNQHAGRIETAKLSSSHGRTTHCLASEDVEIHFTNLPYDGHSALGVLSPAGGEQDDMAACYEPSQQVDYLSYKWAEEDIWSSWRYIVSRRKVYGGISRLENASWRIWAKQKGMLQTVSPETLNWLVHL